MDQVVAAAIIRAGRVLVAQRTYPAALSGLWEFPGGKVEAGEDPPGALVRECREELGVAVSVGPLVARFEEWLSLFRCTTDGEPDPREHDQLRWVRPPELAKLPWIPTNLAFLPVITRLLP